MARTEYHTIVDICDGCGNKTEEQDFNDFEGIPSLPTSWCRLALPGEKGVGFLYLDLCPACLQKARDFILGLKPSRTK